MLIIPRYPLAGPVPNSPRPLLCTFLQLLDKHTASTGVEIPPSGVELDVTETKKAPFFVPRRQRHEPQHHFHSSNPLILNKKCTNLRERSKHALRENSGKLLTHKLQAGEALPYSQHGPLHGHFSH